MSPETNLASRVEEETIGPCRLLMLPTPIRSVVSWKASFCTNPDFSGDGDLLQDFVVGLLDKGTRSRDRYALAEVLEDCGAQLNFSGDAVRVQCRGRALKKDVPEVLSVMAEQLREPAFSAEEFAKVKAQAAASLQRSMEQTDSQSTAVLTRRIYDDAHPNFQPDPAGQLQKLVAITLGDVQDYYDRHFGANDFLIAFAGDVDVAEITAAATSSFVDWSPHGATATHSVSVAGARPGVDHFFMPEKNNIDVRFGHGLSVRRQDGDYVPLYLGSYILGGNFSARLMATVRDEMGLTYGIGAGLSGVNTGYDGHWQIGVTLSRENLDTGVQATRQVVKDFVEEGITDSELDEKKTTITGAFEVGLATTGGLVGTLLRNAERGFDVEYLDEFPGEVRDLSTRGVNDAVRSHFHPEKLHTAMAGEVKQS